MTVLERIKKMSPASRVVAAIVILMASDFAREHPVLSTVTAAMLMGILVAVLVTRRRNRHAERLRQIERERAIEVTDGMDGAEFEKWTARLLARSGCRDVRVVGRSGDMGADVVAISPSGGRLVVQCKRYTDKKVGSGSVQSFSGTAWHIHKASLAMMVTTTAFTKPAQEVAARIPGMVLIDRSALAEWARTDVLPGIDGAVRRSPASA